MGETGGGDGENRGGNRGEGAKWGYGLGWGTMILIDAGTRWLKEASLWCPGFPPPPLSTPRFSPFPPHPPVFAPRFPFPVSPVFLHFFPFPPHLFTL